MTFNVFVFLLPALPQQNVARGNYSSGVLTDQQRACPACCQAMQYRGLFLQPLPVIYGSCCQAQGRVLPVQLEWRKPAQDH